MSTAPRDQDRLARALERARASEDRIVAARIRDEGAQLVSLLCGVLRMVHMHAPDNSAFDKPMRDLTSVLGRLVELLGPVHLAIVEDQVYLNDIRIRLDERGEGARELAAELRKHAVGGVTFRDALPESALRAFAGVFAARPPEKGRRAALYQALAERGVTKVELAGVFRFRATGEDVTSTETPAQRAQRASGLVEESFGNLAADRMPNPLPIRRAVAEMISQGDLDQAPATEASAALGAHAVRVTRLALLLGEAAGLSEAVLQDLGLAAMFHDVGYAAREGRGPGLPGTPPPRARHASAGARLLLRQRGFHEAKVRRVRAVLAHHADYTTRPPLLARILRIAEDFDTATSARGGGLSPDEALARMAGAAGSAYDPALLQAFVNALGRWPPGTLLTLEDGRTARVRAPSRSAAAFDRPTVVIETLADGSPASGGETIDLQRGGAVVRGSVFAAAPPPVAGAAFAAAPPPMGDGAFALAPPPAVDGTAAAPPGPAPEEFVLVDAAPAAPAESGLLYGTVLAQLLARMQRERLSGTLELEQGGDRRVLHVLRGEASAPIDLPGVLRPCLTWDDGRFELRCSGEPGDAGGGDTVSLGPLILAAVRAQTDPDVVRFDLGDIDRPVVPAPEPDGAAASALDRAELFVLSAVDGRITARQALSATGLPALEGQRALLGLVLTGIVSL